MNIQGWFPLGLTGLISLQSKGLSRVLWTARISNNPILRKSIPDIHWRTDAEAEAPILWSPYGEDWFIEKDPDAGEDWGQEEKVVTENDLVGWYHQLNGHESEQTPGDSEGQGSLACCSPWGCKESDTTEWLNWTASVISESWHIHTILISFCRWKIWDRLSCSRFPWWLRW